MNPLATGLLLLSCVLFASCSPWPTESDIIDSLEETLQSVKGDWTAISEGENPLRLTFRLDEKAGAEVSGSGTMKANDAAPEIPITVSGTFRRPTLTLTFHGMIFEEHAVVGTVSGDYTSVGGIFAPLFLSGSNFERSIPILLQER